MKKILFTILAVVLLIILLIAGCWLKAVFAPPPVLLPENAVILNGNGVEPGGRVEFSAEVTLPLGEWIEKSEFQADKAVAYPVKVTFKKFRFDRITWLLQGKFRVLETGEFSGGKVKFTAAAIPGSKVREYQINIPALNSELPENLTAGKELLLAPVSSGSVREKKTLPRRILWSIAAAVIVIAAGIAISLFYRRRRRKAMLSIPLDERTMREIEAVCIQVRRKEIAPAKGFADLCDIIRNYLEERFNLPATRQTTLEFIRNLNLPSELLPPENRIFLTEFLNTSDRIKFAGAGAGENMLDNAAAEAGELIRATTVKDEEVKK